MYQFTKWCFLCASETDVEVDILSLEANLREIIGQFSIIVSCFLVLSKFFQINLPQNNNQS